MNPPMIPMAKQILRSLDASEMKKIADEALDLETPAEIQAFIKKKVPIIAEISG